MLNIEEHENHINALSQMLKIDGVDQAKVSTILQGLRENYSEVDTTIIHSNKKIQTFTELNEDLRSANMGLLSKLGKQFTDMTLIDKDKMKINDTNTKKEDVKSLDDIAKELL